MTVRTDPAAVEARARLFEAYGTASAAERWVVADRLVDLDSLAFVVTFDEELEDQVVTFDDGWTAEAVDHAIADRAAR